MIRDNWEYVCVKILFEQRINNYEISHEQWIEGYKILFEQRIHNYTKLLFEQWINNRLIVLHRQSVLLPVNLEWANIRSAVLN